jgi:hypothetical protein
MSGHIRLHREHGVNPTIPLCMWCGKERGEVALLGAAYKGQAPKHMIIDREPCKACAAQMAKGITIIEAEPGAPSYAGGDGQPKFTGRWVVIHESSVAELFQPDELVQAVLKARKAMMEPAAFEQMFSSVLTGSHEVPS